MTVSHEADRVSATLRNMGLENPVAVNNTFTNQERVKVISNSLKDILQVLNIDLNDDSLADSPGRIARMFVDEFFWGLNYENFPKISTFENKMAVNEPLTVDNISMTSVCEHHFVIFDGLVKVSYIPGRMLIGLSCINAIVNFFARRPQIQERLTQQIMVCLQVILGTENVAVSINAVHYCVKARGIKDRGSSTYTLATGGIFKDSNAERHSFLIR